MSELKKVSERQLKKYDQVIHVEVPVQAIANKLHDSFAEDFPHKAIVTEAIIGSGLSNKGISHVYNALNGYPNELDFKVGQKINCTDTFYKGGENHTIGDAVIKEIDPYTSGNKIFVEHSHGKDLTLNTWVNHNKCVLQSEMNACTPASNGTQAVAMP